MKAFVTGSTGLLGSNLVNALVAAGYQVKALAHSHEKAEQLFSHPHVEIVDGMRFPTGCATSFTSALIRLESMLRRFSVSRR